SAQTADEGVLRAPVELEGFAQRKAQRHVRGARLARFLPSPALDEGAHPVVAARVALRADRLEHRPRRAPIALWPMPVRPEPLPELLCPRIDDASGLAPLVLRLDNILVPQPVANGVPGKPGLPRDLAQRQVVAEMHPPDLGQHTHFDHSSIPRPKHSRVVNQRWVRFRCKLPRQVGQFWMAVNTVGSFSGCVVALKRLMVGVLARSTNA